MSTSQALTEFRFARDFRQIKWGATIWYNLLRSVCAGIVVGIVMYMFPQSAGDQAAAPAVPLIWPFAYIVVFLPLGIVFSLLRGLPFVGLVAAFFALIAVAIGDPIVWILHKISPRIVPVVSPSFFSFYLIFWLLSDSEISDAD